MIWLWLLACATCRPPEPASPTERRRAARPPRQVLTEPAGEIRGGRFIDAGRPFSLAVPPGWEALPGTREGRLRLGLRHLESGARVRIYASAPGPLDPVPRRGCTWTFEADGRFRALPDAGEVRVATCTPDDPEGDHIFAYLLIRSGWLWQLEVHAPSEGMVQAKDAGDQVLRSLRW